MISTGRMSSLVLALLLAFLTGMSPAPLLAQGDSTAIDRSSTGGAPTLEDILARQRGETVDRPGRDSAAEAGAMLGTQLGTRGAASDSDLWDALRTGQGADFSTSSGGEVGKVLMQPGGMKWLEFRNGALRTWGGNLLLIMLILLGLFYLVRDKIRIEAGPSPFRILRFDAVERFAHWLMAGSFVLLAVTGLVTLFGRLLIPYLGHDFFSPIAIASKWVHNNVSWGFMFGLVMVFVFWVLHNLPNRHDIVWLMKGGGIFSKGVHPPARKFNAGQKIIFWSVIILGGSISVSGLSLLFPFEMPLFAATFTKMNALGLPGLVGMAALPEVLSPQEEMQLAQLWHAIVGFVLMAIIMAHIYIGSVGMEGAIDAMTTGEVDLNWAKEHHGLWVDEVMAREREGDAMQRDPPNATNDPTPAA